MKTPYQIARNSYHRVWNRAYGREREKARQFYSRFVRPGALVLDIGASEGRLAETFSEIGARVVAVEPNPALIALMRRRYGRAFVLVEKAVGAQPGEAVLRIGEDPEHSTLSEDWLRRAPNERRWIHSELVSVTTLAELIAEYGDPDFVKIDVEGFEHEVLAGLDRSLPQLSFEFQCSALDVAEKSMARLEDLADYTFAYTLAEERVLMSDWSTASRLTSVLAKVREMDATTYGDVIALRR